MCHPVQTQSRCLCYDLYKHHCLYVCNMVTNLLFYFRESFLEVSATKIRSFTTLFWHCCISARVNGLSDIEVKWWLCCLNISLLITSPSVKLNFIFQIILLANSALVQFDLQDLFVRKGVKHAHMNIHSNSLFFISFNSSVVPTSILTELLINF